MNYLIWYNTEKPHRGIGKLPPLRYYLDNFVTPQQSNMLWTLTVPCLHMNKRYNLHTKIDLVLERSLSEQQPYQIYLIVY
jgi:hypothetical protein